MPKANKTATSQTTRTMSSKCNENSARSIQGAQNKMLYMAKCNISTIDRFLY